MNEQQSVFTYIDKLAKFFIWRRKFLAVFVRDFIVKLQTMYHNLQLQQEQTQQQLDATVHELKSEITLKEASEQLLKQTQDNVSQLQQQLDATTHELKSEITLKEASEQLLKQTQDDVSQLQQQLDSTIHELKSEITLKEASEQLLKQTQDDVNQLQIQKKEMLTDFNKLRNQRDRLELEYESMNDRMSIVKKLLSAQSPENKGLLKFKELVEKKYIPFANSVAFAEETSLFLKLKSIEEDLELINDSHAIYTKNIIGVSGGFSAGKSEFINSFIKNKEFHLTVGINPITAIPSYITCGKKLEIRGYSARGGSFELDKNIYNIMSHDFVGGFGFDLKNILPFMSINIEMEEALFKDICIIDIPGYNPGNANGTDKDGHIALKFSKKSDAIIWVIGLDSNGTISQSDIDFIKQINEDKKMLIYILLNKAGLKSAADVDDIMESVTDNLDCAGVVVEGVCAYDSILKQDHKHEYKYIGKSIYDFISDCNHKKDIKKDLLIKVDEIFDSYSDSISAQIADKKEVNDELKSIRLDILGMGNDDAYSSVRKRFNKITEPSVNEIKVLEESLSMANSLRNEFKSAIRENI